MEVKNGGQLKALIVYFSAIGNTEKIAYAIRNALENERVTLNLLKVTEVT